VTAPPRILFPFLGATLARATLEGTLRTARAQGAVVAPAYLATVPAHLSPDSPLSRSETESALALLELIEQLAAREGVPVDSRIVRGRTPEDALTTLLEQESYDTLVPAPDLASLVGATAPRPSAAAT
jgi:nucleotide-binding universal stress UspA family protein